MDEKELLIKRLQGQVKEWDAEVLVLKKRLEGAMGKTRDKIAADISKPENKIVENKKRINKIKKN